MPEMQYRAGASSSSTHRLTQSSSTLNRRYVERPSNLAIEEAARSHKSPSSISSAAPSRLVNLRVHAADLEQIESTPTPEPEAKTSPEPIVPKVVELGGADLAQIVPAEAPVDDAVSFMPAVNNNYNYSNETALTTYNTYNTYPQSTDYNNYPNDSTISASDSTTPIATEMSEADTQALAMSIAADYAEANLGASMATPALPSATDNSIDTIASAASQAIAAIRTATDPEEVAEQVASLQAFADNIKANSAAPEMLELSDTIEKFVGVAMKSSGVKEAVEKRTTPSTALREEDLTPKVSKSSSKTSIKATVKKPTAKTIRKAPVVAKTATTSATRRVARPVAKATRTAKPASKPLVRRTPKAASTIGVDEEMALRKALRSVANIEDDSTDKPRKKSAVHRKGSGKRFALAFFCAIICVGAIVYFVGSSIPDISVKVAAMQTGIEASYPSYVPREFSLSDINSEDGKITMTFTGPDKATFALSEEKSSWDSTTLLRNFVEPTWQTNYITTHEQGITIYISGANAAWVNGGVLYKIEASSNNLTKKQLRNIVVSL